MAVPCPSLCQTPEEADVHSSPDLGTLARATLWVTLTVCHTLSHLSVAGEQGHELSGEGGLEWNSVLITLLRIIIKYLTSNQREGGIHLGPGLKVDRPPWWGKHWLQEQGEMRPELS